MQILYLPEVWHGVSDESGATIADFGGARISAELALKKRRIQSEHDDTNKTNETIIAMNFTSLFFIIENPFLIEDSEQNNSNKVFLPQRLSI